MIGIVLTGYGKFADGLLDALESVTGSTDDIRAVSFEKQDTEESFGRRLQEAVASFPEGSSILFLCDMAGGIPYRLAAECAGSMDSEVLAGVNLGMLIESSESRAYAKDIHELAVQIFNIGRDQVEHLSRRSEF